MFNRRGKASGARGKMPITGQLSYRGHIIRQYFIVTRRQQHSITIENIYHRFNTDEKIKKFNTSY